MTQISLYKKLIMVSVLAAGMTQAKNKRSGHLVIPGKIVHAPGAIIAQAPEPGMTTECFAAPGQEAAFGSRVEWMLRRNRQ